MQEKCEICTGKICNQLFIAYFAGLVGRLHWQIVYAQNFSTFPKYKLICIAFLHYSVNFI